MQEFNTRGIRHDFKVDGRTYWLPGIRLSDFEAAHAISVLDAEARVPAWRDFLASRAKPGWRFWAPGRRAVARLNIMSLMELWEAWVGLPGEARSSSPVSSPSTAPSSPQTSDTSIQSLSEKWQDTNSES